MKKFILIVMLALGLASGARASEGGIAWEKAPNLRNDLPALEKCARLLVK